MTDEPISAPEPVIESEGMRLAKLRPADYYKLSPRRQWEIDKELGILDWDGT